LVRRVQRETEKVTDLEKNATPMTLAAGTKLGRYEIRSKIGEGGMGEVYRARDEKLNRDVAIKVLPAALSENADRLNLFEQEAQAVGALNHPNILAVYDVGVDDRAPYVVSELLEGETLRERMAGAALPQRKAIDYALQVARGLAAAHEKGIVHRDIKPDNIFLTDDGRVKILDFGLAKLIATDQTQSQTEVPTRKVNTDPGTVMGTMGYMSPEQLKGQATDHRTDIFSFGAILYEMLSGKRAFLGDSMAETMSAILREDPPDLSETNKTISPALERVVRHCLEKNPAERFHSARDLAFAVESLSGSATSSDQTLPTSMSATTADRGSSRRLGKWNIWMVSTVVLGLILLALAGFILLRRTSNAETAAIARFDIPPPAKTELSLLRYPAITLSPDGSKLAFLGTSDGVVRIYLRRRDETEIRALPGTEGAWNPVFSPDGQSLAFFAEGALKRLPLNGSVVSIVKIGESRGVGEARGLTWLDNANLIYTPQAIGGLFQISASGGTPQAVTTVDATKKERTHRWPQALPGGKAVLITVGTLDQPDDYERAKIEVVNLKTGERHVVLEGASIASYVSTGHLVFAREGVLYAVGFDLNRLAVKGNPVAIVSGVAGDKTTGAVHFSIADDGTLAYVPGTTMAAVRNLIWVDRSGTETPLNGPRGQFNDARLSPDGSRVALIQGSSGSGDVWIYDIQRSTFTRFTVTNTNATPLWSADGKMIYYTSTDQLLDQTTIFRKPADGSRDAERLVNVKSMCFLKAILPDGETAVLDSDVVSNASNIMRITMRQGAQPTSLVETTFEETAAAVSPDGLWLAYQSNESGRSEIYVRDIAGSSGRLPISTDGGEEPRWSPDGRELYYRNNNLLWAVPIATRPSIQAGTPKSLFNGVYDFHTNSGETYDVHPKGGRFLLLSPPKENASTQTRIVFNWFGELRRLLPTN
jgi:serine/threonine protein kinase/Tol biopolymer transport system component